MKDDCVGFNQPAATGRTETPLCHRTASLRDTQLLSAFNIQITSNQMYGSWRPIFAFVCICSFLTKCKSEARCTNRNETQLLLQCVVSWHRGGSGRRLCLFQSEDSHAAVKTTLHGPDISSVTSCRARAKL